MSSSSGGEDLSDLRRQWEAYHQINETPVDPESLPELVLAKIDDLQLPSPAVPPKTYMLSRYGKFIAYRILFEGDVEYHLDVEGIQIEKPENHFNTHGGVI